MAPRKYGVIFSYIIQGFHSVIRSKSVYSSSQKIRFYGDPLVNGVLEKLSFEYYLTQVLEPVNEFLFTLSPFLKNFSSKYHKWYKQQIK